MTVRSDSYMIDESTVVRPLTDGARSLRLGMTVGATNFGESSSYDPTRLGWSDDGSYKYESDKKDLVKTGIQKKGRFLWAGVMSNYFMTMVVPLDASPDMTIKGRVQNDVWRIGLERPELTLAPNTETTVRSAWWLGPKDRVALAKAPNDLQATVDLGTFSFIAKPLLVVLEFFHSYVGNWGVAILLLTLCIRLLFWPLAQKSYKSMEQMKLVQPMLQRIKEKYKGDKEAMNREMMQLYRTYKINPASGCLPLLVQIPVFIGLYQALLNAIQLRHASFITYLPFTDTLWLADLSSKDPYYITPLLMGLTMFIQQKMSPSTGDPTQQKVMMFLPAVFTVMFLGFPAGLTLYWLANNILSIGQQWWMLRKVKVPVPVKRG